MSLKAKSIPRIFKLLQNRALAQNLLFSYLTKDLLNIALVCKKFCIFIQEIIREYLKNLKEKFQITYPNLFKIAKLSMKLYETNLNKKTITKIDAVLTLQVGSHLKIGYSYTIGYSYKINKKNQKDKYNRYLWKHQFILVNKSKQQFWLYKENQRDSIEQQYAYTEDCVQIRSSDSVKLHIPFYCSLIGHVIDYRTLSFQKIEEKLDNENTTLCPIEKRFEWMEYQYYNNPINFDIEDVIKAYTEELEVKSIEKNNFNLQTYKVVLRARKPMQGKFLGHKLKVKPYYDKISIELKKKGCYDDRSRQCQLRVGDDLIIYITDHQ